MVKVSMKQQKQQSKATIKEIAKQARTSIATVSRVLRNKEYPVSDDLRQRVLEAAKELQYTPNLIGRYLKSGTNHEIGVIVPTITNPYYSQLILGIEAVLECNQYSMLLCNSFRNEEKEYTYVDLLRQKQVQGIIIASIAKNHDYLHDYIRQGLELVTFDQDVSDLVCTKITVDYEKGANLAIQHLFAMGHEKIGFLSAPLTRKSRLIIHDTYVKAMRTHGCQLEKEWIMINDAEVENPGEIYEFENGKILGARLTSLKNRPTAVMVINDMTAYGVMHELGQRGIYIPEDISIISFDNIFFSQITNPPLTTISCSSGEMGRLAAEYLLKKLSGDSIPQASTILEPQLVERSSVKRMVG